MKAMILAAGVGSRLKPLTDAIPKALIELEGVTMLELVARRLIAAGVTEIVANTFHLADQIADFVKGKKGFGIRFELSRETELLDTGGGLKKASAFFDDGKPFFVHNVDVYSDVDLKALYRFHGDKRSLATLFVQARKTDRPLLFDKSGLLSSRGALSLAFNGVHVVSPGIFPKLTETGVFSIIQAYLRLAALGERIQAYQEDKRLWKDIGAPEKLEEARVLAREKGLPGL